MRREEKNAVIDQLTSELNEADHFYLADIGGLDASDTSDLRRLFFKNELSLKVVKNTLLKKAMENAESDYEEFYPILSGPTSLIITKNGNTPAKMIKEFRKKHDKPILKGAFVSECVYIGDDQLDTLIAVKSKDELIADVVALLQSPLRNVMSSLNSGSNILSGLMESLSERES